MHFDNNVATGSIKSYDKSDILNKSKLTRIPNQFKSKSIEKLNEERTDDIIFHVVSFLSFKIIDFKKYIIL